jgi:hypothetical protein
MSKPPEMNGLEKEKHVLDALLRTMDRSVTEYEMSYVQLFGIIKLLEYEIISRFEEQSSEGDKKDEG